MKKCPKCGEEKSLDCFSKDKKAKDGVQYNCKACKSEYQRRRYSDEADTLKQNLKRHRQSPKYRFREKAKTANIRAKKLGVSGRLSQDSVEFMLDSHGYCCYYCDVQSTDPRVMTLDHVVPFARSGQNTIQNCVPACAACNTSKKDKLESEFNNG